MKNYLKKFKPVWKLLLLIILSLITFSYAMFQGGFVSWFLFYSFMPLAIYGLFLAFYPLKKVRVERFLLKRDYRAGEKIKITMKIHRHSAFPLFFLVIEDCISDSLLFDLNKKEAKTLLFPNFQKELIFDYEIVNVPRGEHFFKDVILRIGDPLSLFEKEVRIPLEDRIVVYPKYEELSYRPFSNPYDQGMTASRERVQRDTSMAVGVREYHPGDRFSWINWKASAKRNDIMTKEFEQRQSHDVYIIMDCAQDKRFEIIVSFTASIVRGILRKGAEVGLHTVGSKRVVIPINGGDSQQLKVFYHLAKIKDDCPSSLDKVLEMDSMFTQQKVSLMIVTAQLSKKLIDYAGVIAQRKGIITIFLIKEGKEKITNQEISLKEAGIARGVNVIPVHEGLFADAFAEVKRG
ncbi:DUF58 domain-containing protein [Bacillus massilinigeriensis]|uniref:DUF58 domain-containing protein n=1 Tax=Bacillus massilionigeriensis TaxID=1805475 RepID=UPI00096B5CBF|nr:DUF58 domain-containing protein [Bacillus massilionigeriensis]